MNSEMKSQPRTVRALHLLFGELTEARCDWLVARLAYNVAVPDAFGSCQR